MPSGERGEQTSLLSPSSNYLLSSIAVVVSIFSNHPGNQHC